MGQLPHRTSPCRCSAPSLCLALAPLPTLPRDSALTPARLGRVHLWCIRVRGRDVCVCVCSAAVECAVCGAWSMLHMLG
eukprot:scaffold66431_cov48-Phaeocystis_antarctica.AAC.1